MSALCAVETAWPENRCNRRPNRKCNRLPRKFLVRNVKVGNKKLVSSRSPHSTRRSARRPDKGNEVFLLFPLGNPEGEKKGERATRGGTERKDGHWIISCRRAYCICKCHCSHDRHGDLTAFRYCVRSHVHCARKVSRRTHIRGILYHKNYSLQTYEWHKNS
ncbi:hypothetical protein DMN91_012645 [Ooceraea biroi]|uniref:Uncharacterized protein n=1 Tax=Ooceraea biroi TaxID=2015173 RepID=A0A3L8D4J6_OOCBI|nr:hypothetical protein DMN91_012645 [Ooceraea biroi]